MFSILNFVKGCPLTRTLKFAPLKTGPCKGFVGEAKVKK